MANTYGSSGNRWWVGMNVGETGSESTIFGTPSLNQLNPLSSAPGNYQSLPSGDATDDGKFAVAAKANKGSAKPSTISVENIEWYNIQGPYTTQAAANAAIAAISKANPAPGVTGQAAADNNSNPIGAVAAAASDASAIEHFLSNLGSANLWIRVAKTAVGATLLIVGLAKITGADKQVGGVLESAVKAAPLL